MVNLSVTHSKAQKKPAKPQNGRQILVEQKTYLQFTPPKKITDYQYIIQIAALKSKHADITQSSDLITNYL